MKKSDKIIKFIIILIIVLFIVILFLISGSFHNYVVSKAEEDKDNEKFNIQENETIIDNSNSMMNEIENNHTLNTNETQEHNKTNPNNEIPNNEIPNNEIPDNEIPILSNLYNTNYCIFFCLKQAYHYYFRLSV